MKTIIVPTDFSRNAYAASEYAAQMALHRGDKLLLIHAFEPPIAFSEYEVSTINYDSMKHRVVEKLEEVKAELIERFGPNLIIDTINFNDNLLDHLKSLYDQNDTKLAVIGLTGAGMVNFLLGSNTLNIVNGLKRAVLTVPPHVVYRPVRKIVFAFDLWNVEATLPIKKLKEIRTALQAELLIFNIVGTKKGHEEEWATDRQKLHQLMEGVPYSFHTVESKRIVQGVRAFAREQQADLIAIVPREHDFLENLLWGNHTKALLFRSRIPILTLPPDEK